MACPEPQNRRTPTSEGRYPGTSRRCTRFQERKAAAAHCLDLPTGCGIVCVCVCPGAQCGPAPHPSWSTSTVLCDALVILPAMVDKMPNVDVGGGARFRHAVPSTVTVDANLFPMSTAGGAEKGVKELEATHTPRGTQAGWLAGCPTPHSRSIYRPESSIPRNGRVGAAVKAALRLRHITRSIPASGSARKVGLKGQVSVPGGCGWP